VKLFSVAVLRGLMQIARLRRLGCPTSIHLQARHETRGPGESCAGRRLLWRQNIRCNRIFCNGGLGPIIYGTAHQVKRDYPIRLRTNGYARMFVGMKKS
jgi:hypothetical protein